MAVFPKPVQRYVTCPLFVLLFAFPSLLNLILQEQFKTCIQLKKTENEVNWKVCRANDLMYIVLTVASSQILACRIHAEVYFNRT